MHMFMYACLHVCMYIHMYVCMYVCMCVCACMHVCKLSADDEVLIQFSFAEIFSCIRKFKFCLCVGLF
jgi:hypothetical protein